MKGTLASWRFIRVITLARPRIYLSALLLFLVFTFLVGVLPAGRHILGERERLLKAQNGVRALEAKKDKLKELVPAAVKAQVELATRALPGKPEFIASTARIQEAAQSGGVNIVQLNFDTSSGISEDRVQKGEIRVDIEGSPSNIMVFIDEVERSLPVMRVASGRLSTGGGISQVSLKIHSFWQKIPDKLPLITEPLARLSEDELSFLSRLESLKQAQTQAPAVTLPSSLPTGPTQTSPRTNPFSF